MLKREEQEELLSGGGMIFASLCAPFYIKSHPSHPSI